MTKLIDILNIMDRDGLAHTLPKLPSGSIVFITFNPDEFGESQYCKILKTGNVYMVYNFTKFYNTGIKEVTILNNFEVNDLITTGNVDKYNDNKTYMDMDIHDLISGDMKILDKVDQVIHVYVTRKINLDIFVFDNMNVSYYTFGNMRIKIPTYENSIDDIVEFLGKNNEGVIPSVSIKY
jgi:hypothetical protein